MDAESFLGNVIEVECGENKIYIGKVDDIDTKLQQISLVDGKLLFSRRFSSFLHDPSRPMK